MLSKLSKLGQFYLLPLALMLVDQLVTSPPLLQSLSLDLDL